MFKAMSLMQRAPTGLTNAIQPKNLFCPSQTKREMNCS